MSIVAPFVGAWIEICDDYCGSGFLGSLRSSERGLKFTERKTRNEIIRVAPFVGAWIEIG